MSPALGAGRYGRAAPRPRLELLAHDVDPGNHLRDRVLDLEPGVQLDEIERPVGAEEELEGAGVAVADRAARPLGSGLHRLARLGRRAPATATPRSASGGAAGSSTRARRASARCRRVAEHLDLDVPRGRRAPSRRRGFRRRRPPPPRPPPSLYARSSSSGPRTSRMPLPPPPAVAFSSTGKPTPSAASRASSRSVAPSVPGTVGTLGGPHRRLGRILSPIRAITSAPGPTKTRSLSTQASTKAGFSARKP